VLEIGAGYTNVFLLQTLVDNREEELAMRAMAERGECTCEGVDSTVADYFKGEEKGRVFI